MTSDRDSLVALATNMSKHAEELLEAEGFHAPMCVLWPRAGREPVAHLLDDSGPDAIAGWAAEIAKAAAEVDATAAVVIMEGWAAGLPGRRSEARETLTVAAENALGQTAIIETPTVSDSHGRRHISGAPLVSPETEQLSVFAPMRAFWRRSFVPLWAHDIRER